jgi:hypothetical protein
VNKRLLGFDPDTGLAKWWHEDGEGNWAQEIVQDNTALLDANKEAQNHCDTHFPDRSVKLVARIPYSVIYTWMVKYGVDYWNPDHQDKVDSLLNSSEWRYLRTDGSVL